MLVANEAESILQDNTNQEGEYLTRLEGIEEKGLESFLAGTTTYDAIKFGCHKNPENVAIKYILRGDYFDAENIPLKAKVGHKLLGEIANPNRQVTYKELFTGINQCANFLHDLNVTKDDVISLLLPNFIETHFALWGGEAAGIVNPVNPLLEAEVIRDILNAAGTKVLIALGNAPGNDIWQKVLKIKDQVPTLEKVLVLFGKSNPSENILNFEKSLKKYPGDKLVSGRVIDPQDNASMFHTGGTTGTPKIALHTHANEVANATMMSVALGPKPEDIGLVGLPLFHVNAAIGSGLMPFSHGLPIVLAGPGGFRTEKVVENFFKIIEHEKVSFFSAVPTALGALLNVDTSQCDLSSLKFAISGAAPIPVETFKNFQDKTGIKLLEGYGLTEATCASTLTPIENAPRIGSIGMRLPFSEIKIVSLDEKDQFLREVGVNEIGILAIRGPNVFNGYLEAKHNEKIWIEIDGEKWLNSGDLGRMDKDGYVWLTGRKKELIIRGGHNIDPKSIEEPLAAMPGVDLVAAIGRPDSYAGEVPAVYLTLNDSKVTEQDVMEYAMANIKERAAIPKVIHIIKDMPVTAVGKIFKPQLTWWQIEEVIAIHFNECFTKSQAAACKVKVNKHETFGCLADITLAKSITESDIDKLATAIDGYNFHYQMPEKN